MRVTAVEAASLTHRQRDVLCVRDKDQNDSTPPSHQPSEGADGSAAVCMFQTDGSALWTGKQAEEMTPDFKDQFAPLTRGRWEDGAPWEVKRFGHFSSPSSSFYSPVSHLRTKKKGSTCSSGSLHLLGNSWKLHLSDDQTWTCASSQANGQIVAVGSQFFFFFLGHHHFSESELRRAAGGQCRPCYFSVSSSAMIAHQSGIVFFKNVTGVLRIGRESWSKWNGGAKWQRRLFFSRAE